jgi:hypothetical protein
MALIFLDRQHAGKPGRKGDRGAAADLDEDGKIETWENEAQLTPRYMLHIEERLIGEYGYDVITLSDGWYSDRHARVNKIASNTTEPMVYCACHLNAGGGNYGAVFYDYRSSSGPKLANYIALALKDACPELTGGVKLLSANSGDWTKHAYNTISGVQRPVGLCLEPCFMDNETHRAMLTEEGLKRIGVAVADGIHTWIESQI